MDDLASVRLGERPGHLARDLDGAPEAQARPRKEVAERLARDQLHDDVGLALFGLAEVVDGGDVLVGEGRDGARLLEEARAVVALVASGVRDFDGDAATQARVFGDVDDTHPALADLAENAVVRDGLADHLVRAARRRKGLARCAFGDGREDGASDRSEARRYSAPKQPAFQDRRRAPLLACAPEAFGGILCSR